MAKVIITGASGMVGKGVMLECLDHPQIDEVLAIVRKPLSEEHPKLRQLIHDDFGDFDSVQDQLKGYDACFACMGVSAAGLNEADYTRMTYDFTMALAQTVLANNPKLVFTYVSGEGTDSSEAGRSMWARVKGKTENDLLQLGFERAVMFRPGAIIPLRGIKSRTKMYQFVYDYFMWFVKLVKLLAPKSVVNTTQIGQAMITVMFKGSPKSVVRPTDIIELSS